MSNTASSTLGPTGFLRFGDLLRFLRRRAQITQRELGIAVGYNFAQICRLEQSQRLPNRTTVASLFIDALGLDPSSIWALRLLELADSAHQERLEASLGLPVVEEPAALTLAPTGADLIEAIPAPVPYEVGRLRLVARLHARLVAERRVALSGLAGVGKTTLAAALAREYAASTPVFWLTFSDGVTSSIEVVVRQLACFLVAHGQHQAQLLCQPQLLHQTPLSLDQQLRLLSAGLGRLAERTNGRRQHTPLLCFDNLHLIQDNPELVHALRHLTATSQVLLLCTSRERVQVLPCAQVSLGGLEPREGLELIGQLTGFQATEYAPEPWAERLIAKTAGNPMLVQLALGQLLDEQAVPSEFIASLENQPQIADYLLETVARHTSHATWNVLTLLAIFRQPINLHDPQLAELLQVAGEGADVVAAIADLTQRHLIDHPARAQVHPLLRDYVVSRLATQPVRRQHLHRVAAEWADLGLNNPVEVAYHYWQAGDLADAVATLHEHLAIINAHGLAFVAADLVGQIITMLKQQRSDQRTRLRQLMAIRGDLLVHTLRAHEAEASYREALALTSVDTERTQIVYHLADSLVQRGQAHEALQLCMHANAGDDLALNAQLYAATSRAHLALSNYDAAIQAAHAALAYAEQLDPNHAQLLATIQIRFHRVLGQVMRTRQDFVTAISHAQQATHVAQQAAQPELILRCRLDEARLLYIQGNLSAVLACSDEILPQLIAIGDSFTMARLYGMRAFCHLGRAEFAIGLAAAEQGYRICDEIGDTSGQIMAANHRALLLIALGRITEAHTLINATLASELLSKSTDELGFTLDKLAMIQMLQGDPIAAQATLQRALQLPGTISHPLLRQDLELDLVASLLMRGMLSEARELLSTVAGAGRAWFECERQTLIGWLALAEGNTLAVQNAVQTLTDQAHELGFLLFAQKAQQLTAVLGASQLPLAWPRQLWVFAGE